MSYLTALSPKFQNLIMLNFEFFAKKFLIAIALFFALFYIFYLRKHQKETPFLFVAIPRTILYYICFVYLTTFPMFIFFLYPSVPIDRVLPYMIAIYFVGIFIVGALLLLNIMYFGSMILVRIAGYNPDKRTDRVIDSTIANALRELGFGKWKLPNWPWKKKKWQMKMN